MTIRNWRKLLGGVGLGVGFAWAVLPIAAAHAEDPVRIAQAPAEPADAPEEPPPQPAPADDDIEEIVVLGGESESAEDYAVGDSVTGFGAEDLAALGAASIADLASFTPNLEIVTSGATTPTFFIRGVGLNDFNPNSTGSVALYNDDVPINAPALQLSSLFDMEAVNILRGPQGTGLARNSSAGAIKLYSRKPTGEFGGFLRAEGGSFNHQDYEGAIEAPIVQDYLSARFAFRLSQRDGTMLNRCGNAPPFAVRTPAPGVAERMRQRKTLTDPPWSICGEPVPSTSEPATSISPVPTGLPRRVNDRNNWAARGTFLFQPTLDMSWLIGLKGSRRDELSRLGQSYGTSGFQCHGGDTSANCGIDFPAGSKAFQVLGQPQFFGYQAPEVRRRYTELAPCFNFGFSFCPQFAGSAGFIEFQNAQTAVARELARDLDDRPWEGDFNRVGDTLNDTWGGYVKGEIVLPGNLEFTTVTGYDRYDRLIDIDLDFSPDTLFQIKTEDEGVQLAQDVKLAGEVELVEDSPVFWDVGGWVLREELDVEVVNDLGRSQTVAIGRRIYEQRLMSLGAYGHFSFDFWDDFTLEGGARWNYEQKRMYYTLFAPDGTLFLLHKDYWREPTGTLRLTYRFREDTHAYWKYSRGWKPGHYNATGSRALGVTLADPETIDAFEAGIRGAWFDGMIGADLSLFYYNYADYQIFTAQQFAGGSPEFVILNANDAEVYGLELDAILRPWPTAFVNVRFAWLESQFLDFVLIQQAVVNRAGAQIIINRELQNSGNPLLNSPKYKVSITAEQTVPFGRYGTGVARYDGVWTDDSFYDATAGRGIPNTQGLAWAPKLTFAQRAFWLHNVRLAYRPPGGHLELAVWVRNLENKPYKNFAFDGSTFQSTTIYFVGDPRTYGIGVTINF